MGAFRHTNRRTQWCVEGHAKYCRIICASHTHTHTQNQQDTVNCLIIFQKKEKLGWWVTWASQLMILKLFYWFLSSTPVFIYSVPKSTSWVKFKRKNRAIQTRWNPRCYLKQTCASGPEVSLKDAIMLSFSTEIEGWCKNRFWQVTDWQDYSKLLKKED